jgi:hypothetical protein
VAWLREGKMLLPGVTTLVEQPAPWQPGRRQGAAGQAAGPDSPLNCSPVSVQGTPGLTSKTSQ